MEANYQNCFKNNPILYILLLAQLPKVLPSFHATKSHQDIKQFLQAHPNFSQQPSPNTITTRGQLYLLTHAFLHWLYLKHRTCFHEFSTAKAHRIILCSSKYLSSKNDYYFFRKAGALWAWLSTAISWPNKQRLMN